MITAVDGVFWFNDTIVVFPPENEVQLGLTITGLTDFGNNPSFLTTDQLLITSNIRKCLLGEQYINR